MAASEKIEKIDPVSKGQKSLAPDRIPDEKRFTSLMSEQVKQEAPETHHEENIIKRSLMDEVRDVNTQVMDVKRTSPEALADQADTIVANIEAIKDKLADPNLTIKNSARTVLRNKLRHIDENLQVALTKAGLEYTPPEVSKGLVTPMERFLGFLTHAETQMDGLASEVRTMHLNKEDLSPAAMLMVQIKVAYVQQEIELFANVLNKALESTKTIMNVQV